ncbi:MAG TPA: hypothetical protein VEB86_14465 [Chryseosolibacter sp.]|nr:hypothetical protein [Chryseosolibacter sp.]
MSELLLEQNQIIKREADELLHRNKLLDVLQIYGIPRISGSYALDLMTWRDLDIYLEVDAITEADFFKLGGQLCEALFPVRMQFRNERIARSSGLPHGLYWGSYLGDERKGSWKVDLWAVDKKECARLLEYCERIRQQLDDVSVAIILSLKSQCWQDPEYRRLYTSADIYDAVLFAGVKDLDGFWRYLDTRVR